MKKSVLRVFALIVCLIPCMADAETSIMVISDPHVLAASLFDDGTALQNAASSDPKLIEFSQELFDSALVRVRQAHPDILLIPGDLTKDGELAGHMYVAGELNKLVSEGVKVYIVPGNHDITNPSAYSYSGDQKSPAASIAAIDFVSLYGNMGYDSAVLRQPDGLSYMVYPADSLAIICLNSAQPNGKQRKSAGGLTEETLAWAEQAAAMARKDERYILAMMHHPVVEHFNMHSTLASTYIANQEDTFPSLSSMQSRLIEAGITVMFTGHFHITSIQHASSLYDISTGSTCAYASPVRTVTFGTGGMLNVTTEYIPKYHQLEQQRNRLTAMGAIRAVANRIYPTIDTLRTSVSGMTYGAYVLALMNLPSSASEMADDMTNYMLDSYTDLVNVLSHGDEDLLEPDSVSARCMDALDAYLDHLWGADGDGVLLIDKVRKIIDSTTTLPVKLTVKSVVNSIVNNYVTLPSNYVPDGTFSLQVPSNAAPLPTDVEALEAKNARKLDAVKVLRDGSIVVLRNGMTYSLLGTRID